MTWEVIADRERALGFLTSQVPLSVTPHYKGLCQCNGDEVVAAVVYDQCNGANIFAHIAAIPGRRWLTRHFLHEMFKYPFVTLGCRRVTCPINSTNEAALRFNEHLGFHREAVLRCAGKDEQDVLLHVMFREDCRYA